MKTTQAQMEARAVSDARTITVMDYETLTEKELLGYDAEIQYVRKEPAVKFILCSPLDGVKQGQPVMIQYHVGKRSYVHSRLISTSNEDNCIGGFYYTDGTPA